MKFITCIKKYFLTPVLVFSMICGVISVPTVYAEENDTEPVENTSTVQEPESVDSQESEETENIDNTVEKQESKIGEEITNTEENAENDPENEQPEENQESTKKTEQPYSAIVTFDGVDLNADSNKNTDFSWSNSDAKSMTVKLSRNTDVSVDTSKKYVVCIKVSELLSFTGLPVAANINGVDEVGFVKNECPKVNKVTSYKQGIIDLPTFSSNSGELRLRLNPSVDDVTIPNLGIVYNKELIGYTGGTQDITGQISASLVSIDSSKDLNQFVVSDQTQIGDVYTVGKITVKTAGWTKSNLKNSMSLDGFVNSTVNEQNVTLGKEGTISYAGATAGQSEQVYKTLVVKFYCPYITINSKKYYLDFDKNDTAFQNKKKTKEGYKLTKDAEYNADEHTITYTFENIYIGNHTILFYSPDFSWPKDSDVKDKAVDNDYQIEGANWEITDQKCYTKAPSSLKDKFKSTYYASFVPQGVNVTLQSSFEANKNNDKISRREIYQGLTRKNGHTGMLGFFDVHNRGTEDSSELKITFDFNSSSSDAKYYVTQVNLPVYGNSNGVDVKYTLINDKGISETGTYHFRNTASFYCKVADLTKSSGFYIKQISYTTKLQKGTAYHKETAHLWRNRVEDSGVFFGYIEGDVGSTASATMKIESVDENQTIAADKTSLSATETSTVSDDNYIGFSLPEMTINSSDKTAYITAGESVSLEFGAFISTEEYPLDTTTSRKVNGYHVFENGLFYLCLPTGVSISGTDQVKVKRSGSTSTIATKSVQKIGDTFKINGQDAQWWQIQVDNINETQGKQFIVEVQLATDSKMNSVSWNFQNCVAVRASGQSISWAAAGNGTIYNDAKTMGESRVDSIQELAKYLESNSSDPSKLGLSVYSDATKVSQLTIARAEAKLNVQTGLKVNDKSTDRSAVSISSKDDVLSYDVNISSDEGGYAKDFSYYIPVVKMDSTLDPNTLVSEKDFNLSLIEKVAIENESKNNAESELPFNIYYTTDSNLTGSTIRNTDVSWKTAEDMNNDFSKVTAVKVSTKNEESYISDGSSYKVSLTLKYVGDDSSFMKAAGKVSEWRSFGYYTYIRNESGTTATYPSQLNRITLCYKKDLTESPMFVELNTGNNENKANVNTKIDETFDNEQTFIIKKVKTNGIELVKTATTNLTGTKANTQYNIAFNMNNITGAATQLSDSGTVAGKQWKIDANTKIMLMAEVTFSKALTDTVTPRYVDVTIGNDNIDITFRIELKRTVAQAKIDGSGVAIGANYQVPTVSNTCNIAQNSAFTALYVLKGFIPGNYQNQILTWQSEDGTVLTFPSNTNIKMMEIVDNKVKSYWYYKTGLNESSIDLKQFKRMGGNENYSYDTTTASQKNINYMFVVDFSEATTQQGTYKIVWEATSSDTSTQTLSYPYEVKLTSEKTYALSSSSNLSAEPKATITYTIGDAENDSSVAFKSLSLVLKPKIELPKDAKLVCGENSFSKNKSGNFIVPVEYIKSGAKTLSLKSDMFPDEEKVYSFETQLYLSESSNNRSPMNGKPVGEGITVEFKKSENKHPSLHVTGKRIGTVSEWINGQSINIEMKNIDKVTVKAYSGNQQVTNVLSSVSGLFDIQSGEGVYNANNRNTNTGSLKLSSTTEEGTYKLVFEVKDDSGDTVLQVPYSIIVK